MRGDIVCHRLMHPFAAQRAIGMAGAPAIQEQPLHTAICHVRDLELCPAGSCWSAGDPCSAGRGAATTQQSRQIGWQQTCGQRPGRLAYIIT